MKKLTTAYHGTTKENYDTILLKGFRVGSYFAYNLADSLTFGGPWVFQVAFDSDRFNPSAEPDDHWQFHTQEHIPADRIVSGFHLTKKDHFKNKVLKDTVFWSNLNEHHIEANARVGITFDPERGILGDRTL